MEIHTNSITSNASDLKGFIDDLSNEYNNISNYVTELKKGWSGDKAELFYKSVEDTYLPELKAAIESITKYYDYISKVPKAYETLDNSYSNQDIEV